VQIDEEFVEAEDRRLVMFPNFQAVQSQGQRERIDGDLSEDDGMLELLGRRRHAIRLDEIREQQEADRGVEGDQTGGEKRERKKAEEPAHRNQRCQENGEIRKTIGKADGRCLQGTRGMWRGP